MGHSNSCGQGYCFPSGWCHIEGSALPEKDGFCSMENDSAPGGWSFISTEPTTPDPPHTSLVHPRVSRCKWNFVHWPFKRLSASLAISLVDKNPAAFHSWTLFGFLSQSWAGEPSLGLDPTLPRGNLLAHLGHWNIPPKLQLTLMGAQPALLCLHTSYQSCCGEVVSSVCPWLWGLSSASVQLISQDIFPLI